MPRMTTHDALSLLRSLGASAWLVRHHELVVEAAGLICDALAQDLGVRFERDTVLLGASVHDAGKIVHPEEMSGGGSQHEAAGQELLVRAGIPAEVARFCVTHASWETDRIEDALVALADKLWKGKRDEALENHLAACIAAQTKQAAWEVYSRFDAICEAVAADGPARLSRSVV